MNFLRLLRGQKGFEYLDEIHFDVKGVFALYKQNMEKELNRLRDSKPRPLLRGELFDKLVNLNTNSVFRRNEEIFNLLGDYFLETMQFLVEN